MKTKIPAYVFMKALGLTEKKIVYSMKENSYLKTLVKEINNISAIGKFSEAILNKETNLL